eukprot:TRINITY_DN67480_c6_g4_i1.p1 TRINITY_DN67480_c6_g4~~TRINITY_DN67480_c6_g4_i1.p1  ORF type:complete len:513 (-),score=38.40 TRINITY_DN67480_c6_g4_i1:207-1691(-)
MNVWLILMTIILTFVTIGTVAYMMIYFSSPDDKNTAWFPKIIVVLSLSLAIFTVLLLPLDVANTQSPIILNGLPGGLKLSFLWQMLLLVDAGFVVLIVPFGICYYEGYDPEEFSIFGQVKRGILWTFGLLVIFLTFFGLGWGFGGYTMIPYNAYTAELTFYPFSKSCIDAKTGIDTCFQNLPLWDGSTELQNKILTGQHLKLRCSPVLYAIAILAFAGWLFFVIFGGVGLASLPIDLFSSFINRPIALTTGEYAARKAKYADLSDELIRRGEMLLEKSKTKSGPKIKRVMNEFTFETKELEKQFKKTEMAYKEGGESPFISFGKILLGILGSIVSILWVLHMILNNTIHPPIYPMLNSLFRTLDGWWGFLGTIAYAVFTMYLLWATIAGVVKVSNRFMFFEIHPLKPHDTLVNSFLFNALVLQLVAVTITQFAAMSLQGYATGTAVNSMFVTYIQNLQGLGVIFKYVQWALLVSVGVGFVFSCLCPYKRHEDDD